MINYIFEVSFCWLGFYLLYMLLLSKETFFSINRWYLLSTLLAGVLIPLLEFPTAISEAPQNMIVYLQPITIGVQQAEVFLDEIVVTPVTGRFSYNNIFTMLYFLGLSVLLLRFLYGLIQIYRLKKSGISERRNGYTFVQTTTPHAPFSFFNHLFMYHDPNMESIEKEKIFQHELAHIQGRHSLDIIVLEITNMLLWCSPLIYFYKRSIRNIHEYLADAKVLKTTAKKQYGQLLLKQSQSGLEVALANNFNHSQLKKRFIMMSKNKSSQSALLKYLWLLPLFLVLVLAFSNSTAQEQIKHLTTLENSGDFDPEVLKIQLEKIILEYKNKQSESEKKVMIKRVTETYIPLLKKHPQQEKEIKHIVITKLKEHRIDYSFIDKIETQTGSEVFTVVDEMPLFPGCEDTPKAERKKCTDQKMLEHIYSNIKYPKEAKDKDIQGMVIVRFVIDNEGNVVQPEIKRSIGGGCDEEVLRVVNSMPKWTPGFQRGEAVNVYFNLPIKFKLDGEAKSAKDKANINQIDAPEVFKVVDVMPRFPGCEDQPESERKKCADKKMLAHVYNNIKYPKAAANQGIEGTAVVRFIVDKSGKIIKPEVVKSVSPDCDAEVLRVIAAMPDWIPGIQRGKAVSVYFNLPVKFKLAEDTAEKKRTHPVIKNQLALKSFNASPNPTSGFIQLKFEADPKPIQILITDVTGKIFMDRVMVKFEGTFQEELDLSKIQGTAFIQIIQDGKTITKQVVIN